MLRIDCWEAEKNLKTTPGSDCALNALAIDEPREYARLYLDGTMQMWVAVSYTHLDREQSKTAPSGIESDTALCRRKDGCFRKTFHHKCLLQLLICHTNRF